MRKQSTGRLQQIDPDKIFRNPDNPRVIFRENEMVSLLTSIDTIGIQVPLTVYKADKDFFLIDGERRWRCAKKLNLETVPCLIQEKPSELENLLLMYNIHALREQWDYYTIASKLQKVEKLMERDTGTRASELDLSVATGLSRGQIRRCRLIMDLPEEFQQQLLNELHRPKIQQEISEDFFIEMERSLKTVVKRLPEYSGRLDEIRRSLITKYRNKTIKAVTEFRKLAKIATGLRNVDIDKQAVVSTLDRLFDTSNKFGIEAAYSATVEFLYDEQEILRSIMHIDRFIFEVIEANSYDELDEEFFTAASNLIDRLQRLMRHRV